LWVFRAIFYLLTSSLDDNIRGLYAKLNAVAH